jgi:uncharacterized protein YegP (UPF0339 family)
MTYEDYLSCSEYSGQAAHPSEANFSAFFHEASQRHFFALLDSTGEVLLKSEGYPQVAARENGIQSVLRNRTNRDFYSVKNEDGKYYISLRAANYREIARSCSCGSEAEALALVDYATGEKVRAAAIAADATAATAERADNKVDDDYMICREYAGHPGVGEEGLVKFTHTNGKHYFAWYDDGGDVLMRSEGYPTTAARDNGYASVLKNRDLEGRYATVERMGRFFTILKAGNHQEIARSCPYTSEAAALAIYPGARAGSGRAGLVADGAGYTGATSADATAGADAGDATTSSIVESLGTVAERTAVAVTAAAAVDAVVESAAGEVHASEVTTTSAAGEVHASEVSGSTTSAAGEVHASEVSSTTSAASAGAATVDTDVEDDYMPCSEYEGRNINDKQNNVAMFKHENGQFYFAVYNADGGVRLRSEGFRTSQERDKELSGALKNLNNPDMYTTMKRGAYSINVLKDKTGREVGRSCLIKAGAAAATVLAPAAVETVVVEAASVETPAVETHAVEVASFAAAATAAAVVAETSAAEAVVEVAAPEVVETVAVVEEAPAVEAVVETAAPEVVETVAAPADIEDDYLPCREYEGHKVNDKQNNVALFKHDNGQFYFAIYNADGGVRLRSEGFLTGKDRDQELSGALKNLTNPDMYEVKRRGIYYITILKDKTGREVGRSCLQKDAPVIAEVVAAAAPVVVETVVETVVEAPVVAETIVETVVEAPKVESHAVEVAAFAATAAAAAAVSIETPAVETTVVETIVEAPVVETVVEAPVVETVVEAPVVEAVVEADVEDDYMTCREYEGHAVTDKDNNVALFKHANGQYYFAVYNADGSVRLRSEGFRTTADRDGELASVLANLDNGDKYETLRRGIYYISILKDDAGHEVGRSCLHKEAPVAVAPKVAVAAAAIAATAAAVVVETPKVEAPVVVDTDVEDDYLPCKDYEGRTINDKQNSVAMFKHENGQYYFAIYNADGSVRIRSEGFRSSQERDKELSGALKNLYNADMYTTIRKGKYYIQILKDKTGREVGRSCLMTEEPKAIVAPSASVAAPIAAVAAAAVASKLVETEKVEVKKEVVAPKVEVKKEVIAPKVEAKRVVETVAPVVTEVAEEAATGGFKWWWLLLPLLLGALWFLKDGCNKTEVAPATTSVEAPKATLPAVDTVKAEAAAPVVAPKAAGCTVCAGGASDDAIFTSVCDNPKKLSRLGTNPEFGNSHALSPEGFYNKIKKAYADNEVDKVFLDKVYKSMGYDGFKDAKADQFTAVVLPEGTSGRLGYSKAHKTGCYTLPDDEYHRKAFHIKSANGCDLHFMKTCGNHFFFCKK